MPPSQAPKRISLVTTELEVGGAERCLVEIASRLDRNHFEPHVISLAPPPTKKSLLYERLLQEEIPVTCLGLRSLRQTLGGIRQLRRALQQQQPDLVQSFLFHANVLTGYVLARSAVPHIMGIRVADPRRWRLFVEKHYARRAAAIACVSASVAQQCEKAGYPRERLQVIPNGIDLAEVDRQLAEFQSSPQAAHSTSTIAVIGRLDRQKGTQLLPKLAELIWTFVPKARFVVAGDGPLRYLVTRWADSAESQGRVHYVGWQPNPIEIIARASVVAIPSFWEGMANVALESMSASRPIVVFDVEGMRELLPNEPQTNLARPESKLKNQANQPESEPHSSLTFSQSVTVGDLPAMAERISKVLSSEELAIQLGNANRQRIELDFQLDQSVGRYMALFEKVVT